MLVEPISGKTCLINCILNIPRHFDEVGWRILFMGEKVVIFLIGPANERWDAVLLIKQNSVNSFLAFESDMDYMKGIGHRTAALSDSRLLQLSKTIKCKRKQRQL